ncbi:hypothetical protein BOX15_Mlig003826g1, partial [Macrostomum lignano]
TMLSVSIHRLLLLLCALVGMATTELVHVSVLFRHGHRSPVQLLPSQNFTVDNYWKDGLGELTNIGKMNEFNLGQFLRKRYDAFLGSRYNSSAHYVRSTDFDRTLMSAQSCLAGLFPPVGDQRWNSQLPWQPIPVHTVPKAKDYLLEAPDFPCPERERQFKQVNADPARLQFYRPYADFLKRLSAGAGMAVTPASVHKVLDTLWINKVEGLPAPAWLNYSGPDWQRLVTVGASSGMSTPGLRTWCASAPAGCWTKSSAPWTTSATAGFLTAAPACASTPTTTPRWPPRWPPWATQNSCGRTSPRPCCSSCTPIPASSA